MPPLSCLDIHVLLHTDRNTKQMTSAALRVSHAVRTKQRFRTNQTSTKKTSFCLGSSADMEEANTVG